MSGIINIIIATLASLVFLLLVGYLVYYFILEPNEISLDDIFGIFPNPLEDVEEEEEEVDEEEEKEEVDEEEKEEEDEKKPDEKAAEESKEESDSESLE